jgi:cellulase/cellobiase CelA1
VRGAQPIYSGRCRSSTGAHSVVYLDAAHSGWLNNLSELSKPLNEARLRHADGFAINVSNFQWTDASVTYGKQLAKKTGKWHFVIDTSRNGAGPCVSQTLSMTRTGAIA